MSELLRLLIAATFLSGIISIISFALLWWVHAWVHLFAFIITFTLTCYLGPSIANGDYDDEDENRE
ncbi:MAG: hypothetical protein B7Y12_04105 [Rhizobiales bacterium 24-66-13]|jgi:CHASE2 domain-containing sensor protein|nr:MAG: hypothetical protein B7Y61_02860 [Rhizobiales bacterium 35-66-30]OYZ82281.1 MAG: hypothetical protein B7Y12_04105 [Rhizobiales bacterium 24-66-13]OZB11080.1 MAG: hypothetical protein B7X67_05335 [Rhizobiales bacterium 39-66-18]